MNAEPFGFGPTAAIAQIHPHLLAAKVPMGFIGEGHALDLQRGLKYRKVVEVETGASDDQVREALRALRPRYSHFLSALDFRYARLAREEGFRTGVYDPLMWFWPTPPDEVEHLDLYVVQNFAGVVERVRADIFGEAPRLPKRTAIAPALVPSLRGFRIDKRRMEALINLGGLRNPFLPEALTREYALLLADLSRRAIDEVFDQSTITAKPRLVETIPGAVEFTPLKIQRRLERVRLALMTPGLGSLFEAASAGTPVVWLPPTNDSQGQQVRLLEDRGMIDARLSWGEITGMPALDYFQRQDIVMSDIEFRMRILLQSVAAQGRFRALLVAKIRALLDHDVNRPMNIRRLSGAFGTNGAGEVAEMIGAWIEYGD